MTERVLVYGNCQAGVFAGELQKILGNSREVRYVMSFTHPTEERVELSRDELKACILVLEQVDTGHPMREALGSDIPCGTQIVRFPPLNCHLLWPFHCVDPRNVGEPPTYPFGRFPYGDLIVLELLREGFEGSELWDVYQQRSITRFPDLQRQKALDMKLISTRDDRSDVKIASLITSEFANRRLFWTIGHPTGWLLGRVFGEILAHCQAELKIEGNVRSKADQMFDGYDPFGAIAVPIHPEVVHQLKLSWLKVDDRYRYLDGSEMTFEETMRKYIDFVGKRDIGRT